MTDEQLDIYAIPDARKQQGMAAAAASTDDWWRSCAMQAIEALAATGEEFQSYDLVLRYGLSEPAHPNQWGPLLRSAARAGLICKAGVAESKRPETNKSLTRTWRGAKPVRSFDDAVEVLAAETPARRGAA